MIQKDVYGDDRDKDFDMMEEVDVLSAVKLEDDSKMDVVKDYSELNNRLDQFVKLNKNIESESSPYQNIKLNPDTGKNTTENLKNNLIDVNSEDLANKKNLFNEFRHLMSADELEGVDGIYLVNEVEEMSDGDIIEEEDESDYEDIVQDGNLTTVNRNDLINSEPLTKNNTEANIKDNKINEKTINDSWETIEAIDDKDESSLNVLNEPVKPQIIDDNDEDWSDCADDENEDSINSEYENDLLNQFNQEIDKFRDDDNGNNLKKEEIGKGKQVKFGEGIKNDNIGVDQCNIQSSKLKSILKSNKKSKVDKAEKQIDKNEELIKSTENELQYENKLKNDIDACLN